MTNQVPPDEDLNSWKEIAAHLGVSVRGAQYREENDGLPIHRMPGKKPRVWATRSEVAAWKLRTTLAEDHSEAIASPPQSAICLPPGIATAENGEKPFSSPVRRPWLAAGILAVVIGSVAISWVLFGSHTPRGPIRAQITGRTLVAMDEMDRTLWQHTFPQPLMDRGARRTDGHPGRTIQVADLYGNGTRQVLFAATFAKSDGPPELPDHDELYCFSSKGEILWQYRPNVAVTLGDTRFNGPWSIMDVLVVPGNPTPRIWLALAHWNWRPGVLLSMTPEGVPDVKFVNAGHFYAISFVSVATGRYILAGGVNNEYAAAALAVVREDAAPSCSPQTSGTRFECVEIPTVNPERYFVFPPTEVSVADGLPYNAVQTIQTGGLEDAIYINIQEARRTGIAMAIYSLSPSMEMRDVVFDDGWAAAHRRAETAGLLHHPLAECPLLKAPMRIRRWEKASGWTTVEVPFKQGVGPDSTGRPR
jgi:hypothetical protein